MKITASESIRNACFDLERLSRMNFAFGETEVRGGGGSPKKFFSTLRASVWSKNKEMGRNENFSPFELSSAAIKIGV